MSRLLHTRLPARLVLLESICNGAEDFCTHFPCYVLCVKCLGKVFTDGAQIILKYLDWAIRVWVPNLLSLSICPPFRLPLRKDPLCQFKGKGHTLRSPLSTRQLMKIEQPKLSSFNLLTEYLDISLMARYLVIKSKSEAWCCDFHLDPLLAKLSDVLLFIPVNLIMFV